MRQRREPRAGRRVRRVAGSNRQAIILTDSTPRHRRCQRRSLPSLRRWPEASRASSSIVKDDARVLAYREPGGQSMPIARTRRISSPRRSRASSTRIARPIRACDTSSSSATTTPSRSSAIPTRACSARNRITSRRSRARARRRRACVRTYVLSQDAYGASTQHLDARDRIPHPGSRGRASRRDACRDRRDDRRLSRQRRRRSPTSSLVTGYDFLQDAADAVRARARGSASAPRLSRWIR